MRFPFKRPSTTFKRLLPDLPAGKPDPRTRIPGRTPAMGKRNASTVRNAYTRAAQSDILSGGGRPRAAARSTMGFASRHPMIATTFAAGIGLNAVAGYRNLPGPQRDNRNDYYLNQMRGRSSGALGQQIPRSIGGYA